MFLEPTIVHFDALPVAVRQRLVASLRGQASPLPTLRCQPRLGLLRRLLLRQRLPWPAGRYVLGAYLVDATREVLRVESALAVVATDVVHHRCEGEHVRTTITFRTRSHLYGFVVADRDEARVALDRLEGDLMALVDAIRHGEVDAVARLDPLFEARHDDAMSATPPAVRPRDRPRLGWSPWPGYPRGLRPVPRAMP
jgi:hypothetical protein